MAKEHVVVSLTTFPAAAHYAAQAVKSILDGSVLPDKIVIYVTLSDFKDPETLAPLERLARENDIFEIRSQEPDLRSYQKLIPAIRDFPNSVVVTIDDDVRYHRHLLRDLLRIHKGRPDAVIANRIKRIQPNRPYREWKKLRWYDFLFKRIHDSDFLTLQTGVGGVLYPPHCLSEEMLREEDFLRIAPTTDDIWFWAAATAKGTKVVAVPFGKTAPKSLDKPADISLRIVNYQAGTDRNLKALNDILDNYPQLREKLRPKAK